MADENFSKHRIQKTDAVVNTNKTAKNTELRKTVEGCLPRLREARLLTFRIQKPEVELEKFPKTVYYESGDFAEKAVEFVKSVKKTNQ